MSYAARLTFEEAIARYRYEPNTGRIYLRQHQRCPSLSGREVKGCDGYGYVQVAVKPYGMLKGHRLAWLLHYGEWPQGDIDHINGVRNDNRIENIRVVTNAVNCQNKRKPSPENTTGYLGVSTYTKGAGRSRPMWRASVTLNRVTKHLGLFDSPEAAHEAYLRAKRAMHEGCTL